MLLTRSLCRVLSYIPNAVNNVHTFPYKTAVGAISHCCLDRARMAFKRVVGGRDKDER